MTTIGHGSLTLKQQRGCLEVVHLIRDNNKLVNAELISTRYHEHRTLRIKVTKKKTCC